MNAKNFLTTAEQQALIQCVKDVETRTSGEIVPVIVSVSHDYPRAAAFGALVTGVAAALLAALLLGYSDMWSFLALFLGAYALCWLGLTHIHRLKKPFLTKAEMNEEVREAALTNFYKHGLHNTRDKTGIIIFVSVYERMVWILADAGINAKVDESVWQSVADTVTKGVREGRAGEALCQAVRACGDLIGTHFPIKSDDTDELPNLIVDGRAKE